MLLFFMQSNYKIGTINLGDRMIFNILIDTERWINIISDGFG